MASSVLFVLILWITAISQSVAQTGVCYVIASRSVQNTYYVQTSYTYNYTCGWWNYCAVTSYSVVVMNNTVLAYVSQFACCSGYSQDSGAQTCTDIDECALGISGCNQNCTNTNGSYVCRCYPGYQISSNNRTCVDVEECALGISGCNQNCANTYGSYVCNCYLGYQISANNRTCVDVDECALGISGCNQNCNNTNGSYVCSCYLGYRMSSNNRTCVDVDECALGISGCNQICTNTNGSYVCNCYFGYQISANNRTCVEILSGDAINLTSTTSIIGIIAAMCAFTTIFSFVIAFIVYKCKAKRRVENQSPSNMTSGDLPDIYMSQCDAYELSNFKTSQPRPADCHDVIDSSNLNEIPSAAVTQKEEAIYEPTN